MKVAAVQSACGEDIGANIGRALGLVKSASEAGARLVCLPELFAYQFFPKKRDTGAMELVGKYEERIVAECTTTARELGIWLIAPFCEHASNESRYFNSLILIDPEGRVSGKYRKMHIPLSNKNFERLYFTPGDLGVLVRDVEGVKVGFGICHDRHFPELSRACVEKGAQLLVFPTSSISTPEREGVNSHCPAWEATFVSRAVENTAYVMAASRPGQEGDITYIGRSLVISPSGSECGRLDKQDSFLVVDLDIPALEERRRTSTILDDTRLDLLEEVLAATLHRKVGKKTATAC